MTRHHTHKINILYELLFFFYHFDSSIFIDGFNICHCGLRDSPDKIVDQ